MSLAVVFPGQGSQSLGMLADLADEFPQIQCTFQEASDALGYDLWRLTQQGPVEQLNETQYTQPALLAAGVAIWRLCEAHRPLNPQALAGHSLGEYTALVAAGVVSFTDAVSIVAKRGELMQEAVPLGQGSMAAIIGLEDEIVVDLCEECAENQILSAANFNSPGQVVVSGHKAAVVRVLERAKAAGARMAIALPVSVPSHCELMQGAAKKLAPFIYAIPFSIPVFPIFQNVDAMAHRDIESLRDSLIYQLYLPVQWTLTVKNMVKQGVTRIVECGPGKVLYGLNRRIAPELQHRAIFDLESFKKFLEET